MTVLPFCMTGRIPARSLIASLCGNIALAALIAAPDGGIGGVAEKEEAGIEVAFVDRIDDVFALAVNEPGVSGGGGASPEKTGRPRITARAASAR